ISEKFYNKYLSMAAENKYISTPSPIPIHATALKNLLNGGKGIIQVE
ncbi:hypothetical protein A2U01_0109870, partial [Trifolium medium]|nr:hypothetical protein [Trifolium medium]